MLKNSVISVIDLSVSSFYFVISGLTFLNIKDVVQD